MRIGRVIQRMSKLRIFIWCLYLLFESKDNCKRILTMLTFTGEYQQDWFAYDIITALLKWRIGKKSLKATK